MIIIIVIMIIVKITFKNYVVKMNIQTVQKICLLEPAMILRKVLGFEL